MLRKGFTPRILFFAVFCVAACLSTTAAIAADPKWAPTLHLPDDSLIVWCEADSICFEVSGTDPDPGDVLELSLIRGPIDYETQSFPHEFTTTVCFLPESSGDYTFVWQLSDLYHPPVIDSVTFTVELGLSPIIEDQQYFTEVCDLRVDRYLQIVADGQGLDLTFELLSGPGLIDPMTGLLTYRPDTSGVFIFEVAVSNNCGHDTATIIDELVLNLPPHCIGFDSTIYLCEPEEICFEILAYDPENDPILIEQVEGLGIFTQTSDTSGLTCFWPLNVDSATYTFIYRSADSCVLAMGETRTTDPQCCVDTVYITVIITPPGELSCPADTTIRFCAPPEVLPDQVCLPGFTSTWETTEVTGGTLSGDTVCVTLNGLGEYPIMMVGSDSCGRFDTCVTLVTVEGNNVPYVTTADDFDISLCVPETICFAASADDLDFDIAEVTVNYGYYDDATDRVCFYADTSGTYVLIVTATDACGAWDSDTTIVTVQINEEPVVILGDDLQFTLCQPEEICIDALVEDENIALVTTSLGQYDSLNNRICFTPEASGTYEIELRVIDDCDLVAADTILVDIDLRSAPIVSGMSDTSLYLCFPREVCLAVDVYDPDDDIIDISTSLGTYSEGTICFVPYDAGVYEIILTATDSCGYSAGDTAYVTIRTDQDIELECPGDTTVFLCEPDTLCFPIGGIPEGAEVTVGGIATYWDAETQSVCFVSDCCLENTLSVSVTTPCGTYSCSFTVSVQTNSQPLVVLPQDTTLLLCDYETICLPVGISDIDGNIADIIVNGGVFDDYESTICFEPDGEGTHMITVTVVDSCGAERTDQVAVTIEMNIAPFVYATNEDSVFRQCELEQICLPIRYGDYNGNFEDLWTSQGVITYDSSSFATLCFTPNSFGYHCISLVATDTCGLTDSAEVCITVLQPASVFITCPEPQSVTLCGPGITCFDVPIVGDVIEVTTSVGTWENGQLCIHSDELPFDEAVIIAVGECNIDTCIVQIDINVVTPPVVECPPDTNVFLCGPDTLVFELNTNFTGSPDEQLTVSDPAWIVRDPLEGVLVYVPVLQAGVQTLTVTYSAPPCDPATCSFSITAEFNTAPTIAAFDSSLVTCELEEICIPFWVNDIDGNLADITSSLGEIIIHDGRPGDPTGEVCFIPDQYGVFEILLTAVDSCEAFDTVTITVTVEDGDRVEIVNCPIFPDPISYCSPTVHCIPIDIVGDNYTVWTNFGSYENGQLCFPVDTSGHYVIWVIAEAECNADTCGFAIDISILQPAEVTCGIADTSLLLCEGSIVNVQLPVSITGDDLVIEVYPEDVLLFDGYVEVPVSEAGIREIMVLAYNDCSRDSCTSLVNVDMNTPPIMTVGPDTSLIICNLQEICIPYDVTDAENNIVEIRASLGVVNGGVICFTPNEFGDYEIIVTATDSCDALAEDTIHVSVNEDVYVTIDCPTSPFYMNIETPDTVRVPVTITPSDVATTVSPYGYYDAAAGELVVYLERAGSHQFEIIAEAVCNSDTCLVDIEITEYIPPHVDCIGSIDTVLCLLTPDTICMPVTITGTEVQVSISPIGYYDGEGLVCVPVEQPGEYVITVTAFNDRDTATCYTELTISGGEPPLLNIPDTYTKDLCIPGEVCFDALISDTDFDIVSINLNYGHYDSQAHRICFQADTAGLYEIIVSVMDDCENIIIDTTLATVRLNQTPVVDLGDDFFRLVCGPEEICVDVIVTDDDQDVITSNIGYFNQETGQVCFPVDTGGVYEVIVTATDDCGAWGMDTLLVEISVNEPPVIVTLPDTFVYLCFPRPICIPVEVIDPDDNLQSIEVSQGTYENGEICIIPYDQGIYEIVVTATDVCGLTAIDTALIEIKTDQDINLVCPGDTTVFLCEPDTVCFPIGGIPEGAEVTVGGIATYWDDENQTICFISDCCLENTLSVSVTTECGTYTCEFTVTVQTNSKPLVLLPQDTTVLICDDETVCLPVGISDIDGNVADIIVEGGTYDAYESVVCFETNGDEEHVITITVVDSCGAERMDQVIVTVEMNFAPFVYATGDSIFQQCDFEMICIPLRYGDYNGNFADLWSSQGEIIIDSSSFATLCFMPDAYGQHCISVLATDTCGLTDSIEICVEVIDGDYVDIDCFGILEPGLTLCQPESVCVDLLITGTDFTVTIDNGRWEDDQLCFLADTSGSYTFTIIADAMCNSDTCYATVPVTIIDSVAIYCPWDDHQFLCEPDTLCYDFNYSPDRADISVTAPAYLSDGQVCVPMLEAGSQIITMTVTDSCGIASCSFTVSAEFNSPPVVTAGEDLNLVECGFFEICVPVSISDVDGNITSTSTTLGELQGDTLICFTPTAFGSYEIIITATDECGETVSDAVVVSIVQGDSATIDCPDGTQYASICGPDTVCVLALVNPVDADVTVLPVGYYDPQSGEVCIPVDQGGTHEITVIAEAQCGSDTCNFNLEVDLGIPPQVICPEQVDTLLCLAEPDTLCIPVEVTGTGVQVNVNPFGYYSAGYVCLPITEPGEFDIEIVAFGVCGADTCLMTVNVMTDQQPILYLPSDLIFERCPDDIDVICIDGIYATDVESPVTVTQICGPGTFTAPTGDSGEVCFLPESFGQIEFCFEAYDGCHTINGSFLVDIVLKEDCDVCARLSIDGGDCTPVGLHKIVTVDIETNDDVGGFDLLLSFDPSALTFQNAWMEGGAGEDWEYFTWNQEIGMIRLVGLAEINNGAAHPPEWAYYPNGTLLFIEFLVANDQNLGGVFVPINFIWYRCVDNSLANRTGEILYIDSRIYNAEGELLWDEFDDINFPESERQFGLGAPDSCIQITPDKPQPLRCLEFINGGVCIISADSIDDRGDINLNGLAYEIADAVVFTNYFIKGLAAFTINVPGQIAATDVNADGITLTVADLSLLIRIIVGDADPVPKLNPYVETATVFTQIKEGEVTISTETVDNLGIAYFVYNIEPGMSFGEPEATEATNDFDILWSVDDGQLKVLMYDIGTAVVSPGRHELIRIPVFSDGHMNLVHSELVDYSGRSYQSVAARSSVPNEFSLSQNYPNPFNPATTISFGLPKASSWDLRIFNITGAVVRTFTGNSDGGRLEVSWDGRNEQGEAAASGVYFYRLDAADFSDTKKMMLLK